MTKILKLSLLLLLVFNLFIASGFELSHDEAYYWLFSSHLDWGYFDHPPVVALIIKLFSFLPHSELTVRIGFVLLQLLTCLLLLQITPKNRHWLVTVLFFSFPLASFAGLLALPDMPLLFMTTLYCLLLKRYLEKRSLPLAIFLGVVISLLFYSKYHGVLVIFFTLLAVPKLFKQKEFYLVAITALITFMPHLWWQYAHDFSTLKYHFFERPKSDFSLPRLFEYTLSQIFLSGLFTGPLIWWITVKNKTSDDFSRAMKFTAIGTVVFFFISTFSKKFEANWTIFLAAPLIYLSVNSVLWEKKISHVLLYTSFTLVLLARLLFIIPPELVGIRRLQEFHGWKAWAKGIEEKCQQPILANTYQIASKLSFYLQKPVHALNYNSRKNQFDYWQPDPAYYQSSQVCYVTDKKRFSGELLLSPEGKKLRIIPGFSPSSLMHDIP